MFNNKTRDTFDEVFLACEDHTHSMLTSLNEEMKNGMASSVANAILSRARKIFGANSFATLERTGGRWTRYQPAREIDSCLQYLKSMVSSVHTSQTTDQSDFRRLSSYVQSLQTIRDFLASFLDSSSMAFPMNSWAGFSLRFLMLFSLTFNTVQCII